MGGGDQLVGRRILVPSARVGRNVLADLLARRGAEVRTFPALRGTSGDPGELDRAAREAGRFAWIVFAGELAVRYFHESLTREGSELRTQEASIAAIGVGAAQALRKLGRAPDVAPRVHTGVEVAAALGDVSGLEVLLLRGDSPSAELPDALARGGAVVRDVVGFRAVVDAGRSDLTEAFAPVLDAVAFGNPATVRILASVLSDEGGSPSACLAAVPVAAAGPATARAALLHDLEPDLVSAGHLADLVADLTHLLGGER